MSAACAQWGDFQMSPWVPWCWICASAFLGCSGRNPWDHNLGLSFGRWVQAWAQVRWPWRSVWVESWLYLCLHCSSLENEPHSDHNLRSRYLLGFILNQRRLSGITAATDITDVCRILRPCGREYFWKSSLRKGSWMASSPCVQHNSTRFKSKSYRSDKNQNGSPQF